MEYRLSPSDLTFLYEGCKRCFVLKVKHGIPQPSIPIPGVFSIISALQKNYYSDKRTESFCPLLPPGVVRHGEKWVRSRTRSIPGSNSSFYINGRFDIVAELDDGSYAVMDFKTGNPNEESAVMYSRQLHAYAMALEDPAEGSLHLAPVTRLGLLYFTPDTCNLGETARQALEGNLKWVEIERDDTSFLHFIYDAVNLLDGPLPPAEHETCDWCRYTERISVLGEAFLTSESEARTITPSCPQCGAAMGLRTGRYGDFWSCTRFPECRGTRKL